MIYRLAVLEDIDVVMEIIEDGRAFLATQNSGQWQDGYPNRDNLINDIGNNNLYVVLDDEIKLMAVYIAKKYTLNL